jgi:hypothetical protein
VQSAGDGGDGASTKAVKKEVAKAAAAAASTDPRCVAANNVLGGLKQRAAQSSNSKLRGSPIFGDMETLMSAYIALAMAPVPDLLAKQRHRSHDLGTLVGTAGSDLKTLKPMRLPVMYGLVHTSFCLSFRLRRAHRPPHSSASLSILPGPEPYLSGPTPTTAVWPPLAASARGLPWPAE